MTARQAFFAGLVLGAGFVVWVFRDYDLEDAAYSLGYKDAKEHAAGVGV